MPPLLQFLRQGTLVNPFRLDKSPGILFISVPVPGVFSYLVLGNHLFCLFVSYPSFILSSKYFLTPVLILKHPEGNHLLSCVCAASILPTEPSLQLPSQFSFLYSLLVWHFACIYFSLCNTCMPGTFVGQKNASDHLEHRVTDSCKLPHIC